MWEILLVVFASLKKQHNQKEGESVEKHHHHRVYELAKMCEYGTLSEEMLRDCLVVDTALSDKLQLDATLTLEKAKKMVRQKEAICEH